MNIYNDGSVKIINEKFSFKRHKKNTGKDLKINLWNVSPRRWPLDEGSGVKINSLDKIFKKSFELSQEKAFFVLWMPLEELHQTSWNPVLNSGEWLSQAVIFSGKDENRAIGYVFSKGYCVPSFSFKDIADSCGERGCASSVTMKFLIKSLAEDSNFYSSVYDTRRFCDIFAHPSGEAALWCRRLGIKYVGYASGNRFKEIQNKLAQQELPVIKQTMPNIGEE